MILNKPQFDKSVTQVQGAEIIYLSKETVLFIFLELALGVFFD